MTADEVISRLDLAPHPEGGWFRQTWVADSAPATRPAGTAIHFLLRAGERSHWHRVDADEMWLWQLGAPLILRIAATDTGPAQPRTLGPDLASMSLQGQVPAGHWQAAETLGDWTLLTCTVTPGFTFEGFELAAPDFDIPDV